MKIQGSFIDKKDNKIEVIIENTNITDHEDLLIGCCGDDTDILFSSDPISIDENLDSTFDTMIMKSGKLELVTSTNLCDYLFAATHDTVSITINKTLANNSSSECVFFGYIEPNVYSQDYAEHLVSLSINFTDFLSTLQYKKLSDGSNNSWDECVAKTNTRAFKDYFSLFGFFDCGNIWYDGSKKVYDPTSKSEYTYKDLLSQIGITDNLFLGDDEDDEKTGEDIIKEILQYLDLHIIQEGKDFYIFDWSTLQKTGPSVFYNINDNSKTITIDTSTIQVTKDFYSDDSTQISIDDVYNQIKVKCDIDDIETIIESPLDNNNLTSFYPKKLKYCTEYFAAGDGNLANDAINNLIQKGYSTYDESTINDWYMRPMLNSNWKFNISSTQLIQNIYPKNNNAYYRQWYVGKYLNQNNIIPSIFSMGCIEYKKGIGSEDNPGTVDMSNYLYISLNGNQDDTENGHLPSDSQIEEHSPLIEYTGQNQAISLSPVDDDTTNYIVFTGTMYYQPLQYESSSGDKVRLGGTYYDCLRNGVKRTEHGNATNVVHGTDNYGYYTRKFWTPDNPSSSATKFMASGTNIGLPRNKYAIRNFMYNYCTTSDGSKTIDMYKKLPMIECEMTVGTKRLIETNIDIYGNSTFKWVEIGSEPLDEFGNKITTFSLGCNPQLEDYIIGTEFQMQNTVTLDMNLDVEGTAIPIKKSDALSGKITFKILGPVNLTWDKNVIFRHYIFYKHIINPVDPVFILAHAENLIIKDFQCKVYTDNGGNEQDQAQDLIYMSDETHNYINTKDDITMTINTLLTSEEAYNLGVKNTVNLSSAIDMTTNLPLYGIDKKDSIVSTDANHKPEKYYVDAYYKEYSKPKIIIETQFKNLDVYNRFSTFKFNYFDNKVFYPINVSYNLMDDTISYKLKEVTV